MASYIKFKVNRITYTIKTGCKAINLAKFLRSFDKNYRSDQKLGINKKSYWHYVKYCKVW
jgi:hypothetical protein